MLHVFKTQNTKQEAIGFISCNTQRKPVSSFSKFKALEVAGDYGAGVVSDVFKRFGLSVKPTISKGNEIKCIGWAFRRARENAKKFEKIVGFVSSLSLEDNYPIKESVLDGLWYLDDKIEGGVLNKRFMERVRLLGLQRLYDAAQSAARYHNVGGKVVWGNGILKEINKGLRNRFEE
jgi:hypothetical protein